MATQRTSTSEPLSVDVLAERAQRVLDEVERAVVGKR